MRIRDLNENVNKFFKYAEERDHAFNPDAVKVAETNKQHYKNGTGVILQPAPSEEENFSNQPIEEDFTSPGYRGLQSIRKLAGMTYDKKALD